jgi:predicted phosphodiesterase
MGKIAICGLLVLSLSACIRPAGSRTELDLEVGIGSAEGINLTVAQGYAAIRALESDRALLWAQAPVLSMEIALENAGNIRLEVLNCLPDAKARFGGQTVDPRIGERTTHCVYDLPLPAGTTEVEVSPDDADQIGSFKVAVLGDIQTALDEVDDVFLKISEQRDLRFVLCTGDVTDKAEIWEFELYERQLAALEIPIYSTIGNHELTREPKTWHRRYGLYSVHFPFKGARFSFVDSGNATLDQDLHARLDEWLDEGEDRIHLFGTHYPLLDPVGTRNSAFRSRNEAAKVLAALAQGNVDLTLYGHIHSYYSFDNASIPAHISGGGGALPERLDGIDRHFLAIELDPGANEVRSVEVMRVD